MTRPLMQSSFNGSIEEWFGSIMTDALEDDEGTVSTGGRTITNLRFADDIVGLAGEEEELVKLAERLNKASKATAWRSVPRRPIFSLRVS